MKPSAFAVGFLTLALVCSGCRDRAEKPKQGSTAQASAADSGYVLRGERSAPFVKPLMLLDGKPDLENRYPSVVQVKTSSSVPAQECSGVLIDFRLVLTAAHCVCTLQKRAQRDRTDEKTPLELSICAKTATVTAVAYLPALPDGSVRSLHEVHAGAVQPHPQFQALRGAPDTSSSMHADLALILLDEPASPDFPPIKLADTESFASEAFILVGFGDDETGNGVSERRRFSKHQLLEVPKPDGDLIVLQPPARSAHQDDLGGPCLRETKGRQVLAGISRRGLGKDSTCISTHIYKAWLDEAIRHAAESAPSNP